MKNRDLIKKLQEFGYEFERHGSDHDVYRCGKTIVEVPRHREVNEITAKMILKKAMRKE